MTLVTVLGQDDADDADEAALRAGVAAYGQVLNTWGAILNSPGLFATYLPFLRQVNGLGELAIRTKELAAFRIAVLNHCKYTASHRYTSALTHGISQIELIAVAQGDYASFDERDQVALGIAEETTTDVPVVPRAQSATGIHAPLRDRARHLFNDRELVELLMSVGMWNALSRFHRVMDFDLDMQELPPEVASQL